LSVDASTIDVNVHPTKTEIKFDNEQPIWQVLAAVVKEALGKYSNVPTIDFDVADRPDIPVMGTSDGVPSFPKPIASSYNPFTSSSNYTRKTTDWQTLYKGIETFEQRKGQQVPKMGSLLAPEEEFVLDAFTRKDTCNTQPNLWHPDPVSPEMQNELFADVASLPHFQYKGRFIIVPLSTGLLLVDQHRAHVRILYEEYIRKIHERKQVAQGLLFPEIIQFTKTEELVVEQVKNELEYIGFELSNLGGGSYSINGVPSGVNGLNPQKLLHDLIYVAMEQGNNIKEEIGKSIALAMAQSAAIVYGQVLSDEEIVNLLKQLFQLSTPFRTPDGKHVFNIIEHHAIEQLF
jgi:DNA mismatch repair protein MutL